MVAKLIDGKWLVRIERGEEIVESITKFLNEQNIRAGSISGIGAASKVTLRYYSMVDKQYHGKTFEGEFEIASMNGNVSVMNGKIWPHIHIVLGDIEYQCFGGHLESGIVGVTCEVVIDPLNAELVRFADDDTGLNLWDLS